jgi:hypothetical protein
MLHFNQQYPSLARIGGGGGDLQRRTAADERVARVQTAGCVPALRGNVREQRTKRAWPRIILSAARHIALRGSSFGDYRFLDLARFEAPFPLGFVPLGFGAVVG